MRRRRVILCKAKWDMRRKVRETRGWNGGAKNCSGLGRRPRMNLMDALDSVGVNRGLLPVWRSSTRNHARVSKNVPQGDIRELILFHRRRPVAGLPSAQEIRPAGPELQAYIEISPPVGFLRSLRAEAAQLDRRFKLLWFKDRSLNVRNNRRSRIAS